MELITYIGANSTNMFKNKTDKIYHIPEEQILSAENIGILILPIWGELLFILWIPLS